MKKRKIIDVAEVRAAMEELISYKRGRAEFDRRVAEEEEYYRLRVRPKSHKGAGGEEFAPASAWLVNSILQKHAELMEHIPTAVCLAREPDDRAAADCLSTLLPVVLERSGFEGTYSDNMWYKLKHGVSAFGVFWNNELDNGLGDIDVRRISLCNLFWQPGVRDLEESRSVFLVERVDAAALRRRFPKYDGNGVISALPGLEESGDGEKVVVVDWYYKKRTADGRTLLHYCKFAGDSVLFASENEPGFEEGWYAHGRYPFVLDVLYPIEEDCVGFGMIALGRDPQTYIDRIDRNLLEYMDWATRVRFFCKKNTGINEKEFLDLDRRIVEVEGDLDEERLRQIRPEGLSELWLDMKNAKIEELRESTSHHRVAQGVADKGVVAASAIASLQEASNKTVRDIVAASYRAFVRVVHLVIECMRQFYSEGRCFRVLGRSGEQEFIRFSSEGIRERICGTLSDGTPSVRRPIFDIDVRAEKRDPYSRLSHNEMLKDLYRMGVFEPQNAAAARVLLSAMDFSGVAEVRALVERQAADGAADDGGERAGAVRDPLLVAQRAAERVSAAAREEG